MIKYLYSEDELMCKVLATIGYHDIHETGEIIPIRLKDITQLIQDGYVELYMDDEQFEEIHDNEMFGVKS